MSTGSTSSLPSILWMVPTYGRKPKLLANCLACFVMQDYPLEKRFLIMYDDLGNVQLATPSLDYLYRHNIYISSTERRCSTLPDKYRAILRYSIPKIDYVFVVDDDDIYMPWHTSSYVEAMMQVDVGRGVVAYPRKVWSLYTGTPRIEQTGGRFWASIAADRSSFESCLHNGPALDYDQQTTKALLRKSVRCTPDSNYVPSFCMRWASTGHFHASARTVPGGNWYDAPPQHLAPILDLAPEADLETHNTIATICSLKLTDLTPYEI